MDVAEQDAAANVVTAKGGHAEEKDAKEIAQAAGAHTSATITAIWSLSVPRTVCLPSARLLAV